MTGARLVKRMAFTLLSGEVDQYVSYLPDIQGKGDCVCAHKVHKNEIHIILCTSPCRWDHV